MSSEVDELLASVELTADWTRNMRKDCPVCGSQMEITAGLSTPNAAKAYCHACGFTALMTAPREDWDSRWNREDVEV